MARRRRQTNRELRAILEGLGIPRGGRFARLVDVAVRQNWSMPELLSNIYRSKAFKRMFPGIFRGDGSLKMSPVEYLNISDTYISQARIFGVGLSRKQIGALIGGDVSAQEFTDRLTAIERIREFGPALDAFKEVLAGQGIKNPLATPKELRDFVLGEGPKEFYDLYEKFNVNIAAGQAGLDLDLSLVGEIAKLTPGVSLETDLIEAMQSLARHVSTTLPASQLGGFGITQRDLVQLEFGGPQQRDIAERVTRALATAAAKSEPTAATELRPRRDRRLRPQSL